MQRRAASRGLPFSCTFFSGRLKNRPFVYLRPAPGLKDSGMKRVKLAVLKNTFDEQLSAEYGAEVLGPCPKMKAGQVFYADHASSDQFFNEAWKAV